MLKIDRDAQTLTSLESPTLADCSITERYDLQEYISNSPSTFFGEIGQKLSLLGKEIVASANVQDRIDILAIDKSGTTVIVELKRGNHKLHMLQAISYAGMIAEWTSDELLELLDETMQDQLAAFLDVELTELNRRQRIVLLAEAYDYALLVAAKWLSERYGVDLVCCRLAIAKDPSTGSEFLVCSNVHPPPELAEQAIPRGRRVAVANASKWSDWEAALADVSNSALVRFYQKELTENRDHYLPKRILHYTSGGKRHWFVAARRKNAYVWQRGRFVNDVEFWQSRLQVKADVKPVKDGKCLRLSLHSEDEFETFHASVTGILNSVEWIVMDESVDGGAVEEM